jgi:hypothetical protein
VLTLYDRMLGTYTPAERAPSVVNGLKDADPAQISSFHRLLSMPFRRPQRPLTQKSGSHGSAVDNILV